MVSGLVEAYNPETGQRFYREQDTGETSWTKPATVATAQAEHTSAKPIGEWSQHVDPASGRIFYYNKRSGESCWKDAASTHAVAEAQSSHVADEWTEHKDSKTGSTYYYNSKTGESTWTKPTPASAAKTLSADKQPVEEWSQHTDPATGQKFYHNARTEESSWLPPSKAQAGRILLSMAMADTSCPQTANPRQLGGSSLHPVTDDNVLNSLQDVLQTRSDWLGIGRDVRYREAPYSQLQLCKAWRLQHEAEERRYDAAAIEVAQQCAEMSSMRTRSDLTRSFSWSVPDTKGSKLQLRESLNEVFLLHGTTPQKLPQILATGLNERYADGTFGSGVYLSDDAGKCDQYSVPDKQYESCLLHEALFPTESNHPGNIHYLLLCRVLLGCSVTTRDGESNVETRASVWADTFKRELALTPWSNPPVPYHSLVVEVGEAVKRYREVVMFHSDRVLFSYLIAYKRCGTGAGVASRADPELGPTTMKSTSVPDAPSTATKASSANEDFYYWVLRKLHYPLLVKSTQEDYDKFASKYPTIIEVGNAGDGRVPGYYYRSEDRTASDAWIPKDMHTPRCTWSLDTYWYSYFKSSKVKRDGTFDGQPKDIIS